MRKPRVFLSHCHWSPSLPIAISPLEINLLALVILILPTISVVEANLGVVMPSDWLLTIPFPVQKIFFEFILFKYSVIFIFLVVPSLTQQLFFFRLSSIKIYFNI